MENTIEIYGRNLEIKEYNNQRVVTFRDIDEVHQRPTGTARKRFNDNRKHFIEGEDYFKITPSEFRTAIGNMDERQQNNITLITESGYLMLVKSFTDDLAWKVQRELVKSYFTVKAIKETASFIDTDKLIRCGEIMAGCLEGNRPYVLNILRNIFPDIDFIPPITETSDVSVKSPINKPTIPKAGYKVGFNAQKFAECLRERGLTSREFGQMIGCNPSSVTLWQRDVKPGTYYRILICEALGVPQGYFDKKTRRRR